ncbi:MAG: hypothetical protein WDO12_11985 [Pseudomonadota bacterium]
MPLAVAQSEHHEDPVPLQQLHELVVVPGARHEQIHNLVTEAQEQLANVKLQYVFTGNRQEGNTSVAVPSPSRCGAKRRWNG